MGEAAQFEAASRTIVEFEGLSYRYRGAQGWALKDIDHSLRRGIILGIVGPNGSGKTTLFRLILGFVKPTVGTVKVDGGAPAAYRTQRGIGYLPEAVNLPPQVKVAELADYAARLSGLGAAAAQGALQRLMSDLEITRAAGQKIGVLSHGYRRRIGLMLTLLGDPELLLLDEPATGLDPDSIGVLRSTLRALRRQGRSVIVSSHNLLEMQRMCDEVLILRYGEILGASTRDELLGRPAVWVVQLGAERDGAGSPSIPVIHDLGGVRLAADEFGFTDENNARRFAASMDNVQRIERREFDLEYFFHSLLQRKVTGGTS